MKHILLILFVAVTATFIGTSPRAEEDEGPLLREVFEYCMDRCELQGAEFTGAVCIDGESGAVGCRCLKKEATPKPKFRPRKPGEHTS